ncbi:hypothetical protein ACFS07_35405 [Undibacterium arcticum]
MLRELSPGDIAELKKDQYTIESQFTFWEGMREILSNVHTAVDEPVLKDAPPGTIVRYSHSSVKPTVLGGDAKSASDNLERACNTVVDKVVIEPGDVLIVSNRLLPARPRPCRRGALVGKQGGCFELTRWIRHP